MKLEKNSYTVLCQEKNSITRGLGKKLDHVSFGGLLINVLANILVDYRSIYWPLCRPTLGRLSTDMMATLGRYSLSVNSRPILWQRIPWSTCRSKYRSTCQSMNWLSGSLVSANCWSRGCVLADMGLVLGHYSLLVDHGTAVSQPAINPLLFLLKIQDCRSFSVLKTLTGSQAESPAFQAFQDRLTFLNRHMIV